MTGKMTPLNAYRVGTRAREPRRIKEPEGLDGSARGSKPEKKVDDKSMKAKPGLVIDQARYRAPTQFQRAAGRLRWQSTGSTIKSAT